MKLPTLTVYCLLLAGFSIALTPSIHAQTLANWDFTGADGGEMEAHAVESSVAAGITVSPITRGDGFTLGKPSAFTINGYAIRMIPGINTFEEALEKNAYFEITVTPTAGKAVSIEKVVFNSKRATKKSGPLFVVVRSSLDDYSSDIAGPLDPLPQEVAEGSDLELSFAGTLNGVTKPVTLRFYAYGQTEPHNPSGGNWVIGNSSLTGGFTLEGLVGP